jgi:hypothetical protein
MKTSFISKLFMCLFIFAFLSEITHAQYFNKYYTWASEKHIWPGQNNARLPFVYENILYVLNGNYYGAETSNGINIPSIAYILKRIREDDTLFAIFTVESRGFRIFDPVDSLDYAGFVNRQEGLNLDFTGNIINGEAALSDAYTEHPTIERFLDSNDVFADIDSIKFAVSGNFYGDKDEIMLIFDKADSAQKFVCLSNNLC